MTPINAKSVQLIELHAFAYCLLSVYLSESLHSVKGSLPEKFTGGRNLVLSGRRTGSEKTNENEYSYFMYHLDLSFERTKIVTFFNR